MGSVACSIDGVAFCVRLDVTGADICRCARCERCDCCTAYIEVMELRCFVLRCDRCDGTIALLARDASGGLSGPEDEQAFTMEPIVVLIGESNSDRTSLGRAQRGGVRKAVSGLCGGCGPLRPCRLMPEEAGACRHVASGLPQQHPMNRCGCGLIAPTRTARLIASKYAAAPSSSSAPWPSSRGVTYRLRRASPRAIFVRTCSSSSRSAPA